MRHLQTIALIARCMQPLLRDALRTNIYHLRLEGTKRCLTAWATDGHVMARLVALGNYAEVGKKIIPGSSVLQASELGAEALNIIPATRDLKPTPETLDRLIPPSRASKGGPGFFLGPALSAMAEVTARFGARVQFAVNDDWKAAMRVDSLPFTLDVSLAETPLAWLTIAVMPARPQGGE